MERGIHLECSLSPRRCSNKMPNAPPLQHLPYVRRWLPDSGHVRDVASNRIRTLEASSDQNRPEKGNLQSEVAKKACVSL